MTGHCIVCGMGDVGYRVAELLHRLGEKVTVVTLQVREERRRAAEARTRNTASAGVPPVRRRGTPLAPRLGGQTTVRTFLVTDRQDYVTHIASADKPIILSFERGQGRVILSAAPFPFSNTGLKKAGNPALVLNLVSAAKRPGLIWFDEWHHGLRTTETRVVLTDPESRRRFLRYWRAVGPFSRLIRWKALRMLDRRLNRPRS